MRLIAGILNQKVAELDQNLANAIQMTIEKLPIGDIEPPNPFQVMLLQLMQDKMANNPAKVIARDEQGLFTAESETESNRRGFVWAKTWHAAELRESHAEAQRL